MSVTMGKLTREQTQQMLADAIQDVDELILRGDVSDIQKQALIRSADHLLVASKGTP
jgi:NAD-specific glutamate dehydrogenase